MICLSFMVSFMNQIGKEIKFEAAMTEMTGIELHGSYLITKVK